VNKGNDGTNEVQILQVVIYFGAIVSLLYYCGVMQFVLTRLASFVQLTMGTTATESFNAVACIFLGQVRCDEQFNPSIYIERGAAHDPAIFGKDDRQ
jgi:nucleoside permease NupC